MFYAILKEHISYLSWYMKKGILWFSSLWFFNVYVQSPIWATNMPSLPEASLMSILQYNLNGSKTDGLFTVDDSNSFFSPYKFLPIAQENK